MKTLYLECAMGAAGDMLMAALWELAEDKAGFLHKMNHLFPGLQVQAEESGARRGGAQPRRGRPRAPSRP